MKDNLYNETRRRIELLLEDETDWIAAMSTVAAELHNSFDYFHWTGFYRRVEPEMLAVGPYQGGHGCLRIAFDRGVCGAAARSGQTQLVEDVEEFPGHIACSASTRSEIVVPIISSENEVIAVLDVDSDFLGAFDNIDKQHLESLCGWLGQRYG